MTFRASYPSFAGGEVSEAVAARWDVAKYTTALSLARNTLGLPQGGQYNRPGFLLCDRVPDSAKPAVLFPFIFATGNAYPLEFSPNKMRVYYRGELVTRPRLTITAITREAQAVVTAPAHGYVVGWVLAFDGVAGMVEINGLRGRVVKVLDADRVRVDLDTSDFGAFTGDSGGVLGNASGGTGGEPPFNPDPPPVEQPDNPKPPDVTPPPRCPAPETMILLANETRDGPGVEVRADELKDGLHYVWTQHERTLEWGAFFVLRARVLDEARDRICLTMQGGGEIVVSRGHRFFVEGKRWVKVETLMRGDVISGRMVERVDMAERGPVVEIMIHQAMSYVAAGLLCHNIKYQGEIPL